MLQPGTVLNKRYEILRELKGGGFSRIFEVRDRRQRNFRNVFGLWRSRSIKILKILIPSDTSQQNWQELFRREIRLLKVLDHPNVVRYVEDFDYWGDRAITPCLILEQVPGQTLEDWLKENGSPSEEQVLDWLAQFVDVLDYLHNDQHIIHLDIKPANVIITPTGQLVLIDFGAARPISPTLFSDLVDPDRSNTHRVGTPWYMAPEQAAGQPITHSDVYAVGRTLIQAIANCPPEQIPQNDEGDWDWNEIAPQFSTETQILLTNITTYSIIHRFCHLSEIRHKLNEIHLKEFAIDKRREKTLETIWDASLRAIGVTTLVVTVRFLGILQPFEAFVYDQFLRLRLDSEGPDERIVIIEVARDDWELQHQMGIGDGSSLSNTVLETLLTKIQFHEPAVVGLDLVRYTPVPSNLKSQLIAACSIGSLSNPDTQLPPPPSFPSSQTGFADLIKDRGWIAALFDQSLTGRTRRLIIEQPSSSHCETNRAFSFQIASKFLKQNGFMVDDKGNDLILSGTRFRDIKHHQAFYAGFEYDQGYQVLLNYRPYRLAGIKIKLSDILENRIQNQEFDSLIRGKVVLIGTTDSTFEKYHMTPYGSIPGVIIHAHAISHFLDVGMNQGRRISYLNRYIENSILLVTAVIFSTLRYFFEEWNAKKITFFSAVGIILFSFLLFQEMLILMPSVPTIAIIFLATFLGDVRKRPQGQELM